MSKLKKMVAFTALMGMISLFTPRVEAVTYVTDTGGYAYDECRAATNLAPAIALGTVAIVGIIAIAVQNRHDHSDTKTGFTHCCCKSDRCHCVH